MTRVRVGGKWYDDAEICAPPDDGVRLVANIHGYQVLTRDAPPEPVPAGVIAAVAGELRRQGVTITTERPGFDPNDPDQALEAVLASDAAQAILRREAREDDERERARSAFLMGVAQRREERWKLANG